MERRIRTVLEMDEKEAKAFFMRSKSYCTLPLPLPLPFNFDNVLTFVANKIGKQDYLSWLKDSKIKPSSCDQCSYKIQIAKNSSIAYRTITLVNPYLYYLLVREITREENWKLIRERMEELSVPWIERCAIPGIPADGGSYNTEVGEQILIGGNSLNSVLLSSLLSITICYILILLIAILQSIRIVLFGHCTEEIKLNDQQQEISRLIRRQSLEMR